MCYIRPAIGVVIDSGQVFPFEVVERVLFAAAVAAPDQKLRQRLLAFRR